MNFLEHVRLVFSETKPPAFDFEGSALLLLKETMGRFLRSNITGVRVISDKAIELHGAEGVLGHLTFCNPKQMDALLLQFKHDHYNNGG